MNLKALDTFGTIGTRVEHAPEGNRLVITTPPAPYGQDGPQAGLFLADDFNGRGKPASTRAWSSASGATSPCASTAATTRARPRAGSP